jgi:hypothetical protein
MAILLWNVDILLWETASPKGLAEVVCVELCSTLYLLLSLFAYCVEFCSTLFLLLYLVPFYLASVVDVEMQQRICFLT